MCVSQSAANHSVLPRIFRWNPKPFATPVSAIGLLAVIVAVLMNFDFELLVIIDSVFSNVPTLLGVIAFVRLKFTEPDLPRLFAVPGVYAHKRTRYQAFHRRCALSCSSPVSRIFALCWLSLGGRIGAVAVAVPQLLVMGYSFVTLGYSANLVVSLGCLTVVVAICHW